MSTNSRTPSFHILPKQKLVPLAVSFLDNLKRIYFADNLYQEIMNYLDRCGYAEESFALNIPLVENIYGLIMLRRHIWLYANTLAMFNTSLDLYQAVECINRTILIFDYTIYIVTQKYAELSEQKSSAVLKTKTK
jgi:hypothetical protein